MVSSNAKHDQAKQLQKTPAQLINSDELRKRKQRERSKRYYDKLTDVQKREMNKRKRERLSPEARERRRKYEAAWHRCRRKQPKYIKEKLADNDNMNSESLPSGSTSWDCKIVDEMAPQFGVRMYQVSWLDSVLPEHKISAEAISEWTARNEKAQSS
jgi:hypothetical protein